MPEGCFNIKRDNELIAAGTHFFCEACLVAVSIDDRSVDPRYCQDCYEFLNNEAELITGRPKWLPDRKIGDKKVVKVSQHLDQIMATIKDPKNKVAIIPPSARKVSYKKRGPKHKALPIELITQWVSEGMGYKRIAARLKAEYGIEVGFRTVARVVKGERLLLEIT